MPADNRAVIFSAPQGWGKTPNAEKLRVWLQCSRVVDSWEPGKRTRFEPGVLYMTNVHPGYLKKQGYDIADVRQVYRGWDAKK